MGLGTKGGGVASAKFAHKHGAIVTITDLQTEEKLKKSIDLLTKVPKKLVLGKHLLQDFEDNDIIIKNPGIKYTNKYLQHATKYGRQIETPISLFLKLYQNPFIGITGTKGKSYTTALASHLLSTLGIRNIAAGNNCVSPLDYIEEDLEFVMELSSWQLHEMGIQKVSPAIACWLNFFPDHMNYYNSVNEYFNDKSEIFLNQSKYDFCIIPYKYTKLKELIKCNNKIFYSKSDLSRCNLNDYESVCYIKNNCIYYKNESYFTKIVNINNLKPGYAKHQLELVLATICITIAYLKKNKITYDDLLTKILKGLNTFKGLKHRFETIFASKKLNVINDSASSTPESTITAINSISNDIILISGGGNSKNLNYSKLAYKIIQLSIKTILFSRDKPSENLINLFERYKYTNYTIVSNLNDSIDIAFVIAKKHTESLSILFSPACSGYPRYTDMFERGNVFNQLVKYKLRYWGK